jgi:signal transduction histidine kinase
MQRQVRELIARLRPTRAAELGLEAAVADLVSFWQARQPELQFVTRLDGADADVPEPLRDVIYRVVQESVANALRHAQTKELSIAITRASGGVAVTVENRGAAKSARGELPGLGLPSMRERVHAAGGELSINRASEGWTILARFNVVQERVIA